MLERSELALGLALGSLLALMTPLFAHAREITDATGTRVKLQDHPVRIVTLAPSLGELTAELSAHHLEHIVGVSEYTDYPPALSKVASVGSYSRFNLEKVASLKPDLVLATLDGNPRDQVLHLRELGVPVVVVATETLSEVGASIELIAQAMGVAEEGARMASAFKVGVERVRESARKRKGAKARVMLQIGDEPLVVVGGHSFLQEALETIGAENVYADTKAHYPRPSIEDAIHRDADVIVVLALGHDLTPFKAMAARWSQYPMLKAVRAKQVKVLQGDAVLRPTLRFLDGLSLLDQAVHGKK
jgi:iron complex transport system substrate-binding protein